MGECISNVILEMKMCSIMHNLEWKEVHIKHIVQGKYLNINLYSDISYILSKKILS